MWTQSAPVLHFQVAGHGPPLLLLHEIGGSLRSWDTVVARIADRFTLIRLDQRGFGQSEKPRATYTAQGLVDDALRVLDATAIAGPVGIVAAAGACATAVAIARGAPDRVSGLVLCAPALGIDANAREAALARAKLVAMQGMRAVIDGAMASIYPDRIRNDAFDDYRARFLANDPVAFAMANRAFAATDVKLAGLPSPLLLLAGTDDIRPIEAVAALAAQVPHAQFAIVSDGGHVMAMQQPQAVATHIAAFFEDASRADHSSNRRRGDERRSADA